MRYQSMARLPHPPTPGLSLGATACNTSYCWACFVSLWCYGWNCFLLIEFTHKVTSLLWMWNTALSSAVRPLWCYFDCGLVPIGSLCRGESDSPAPSSAGAKYSGCCHMKSLLIWSRLFKGWTMLSTRWIKCYPVCLSGPGCSKIG